jgi:hypothetical protein
MQQAYNFPLSTEFFYWLVQENLDNRIILEKIHDGIYERISEYYIDSCLLHKSIEKRKS